MNKTEPTYKKQAIKAAKDLRYGDEIIKKLKAASTDGEIERIMIGARKEINGK